MGGSTTGSLTTAAIVVTCDRRGLLEANLATLQQQSLPFSRLLVVDNGSRDGSREWLEALGSVEVIALESNLGFAAAMNRGIEVALANPGVDLIASINNDVRLDADWHREAQAALRDDRATRSREEGRKVGSVATLMLQQDDPGRIDSAGIEWHGSGRALNRWHGADVRDLEEASISGRVWGASAAAALYSRELLESIGGFDETFFAYQDDVDLAVRARLAGFGSCFAHRAIGWHLGHGSNRSFALGGTRADFLNSRNRLAVMVSARLEGEPLSPMFRSVLSDLLRSIWERRAPAVWLGTAQGLIRWPRSMRVRRALHRSLERHPLPGVQQRAGNTETRRRKASP